MPRHNGCELDATAAFEVYGQSAAAATVALASDNAVRTRHGLVLLTTGYAQAPGLSRVVVPGAGTPEVLDPRLRVWAAVRRLTLEPLAGRAGRDGSRNGGFTAALQNLSEHTDAATTSATAKMIGYPTTGLDLGDRRRSGGGVVNLQSEGAGAPDDLIPTRVSAYSGGGDDGSRP